MDTYTAFTIAWAASIVLPTIRTNTNAKSAARVSYLNGGDHPRKPFPAETI